MRIYQLYLRCDTIITGHGITDPYNWKLPLPSDGEVRNVVAAACGFPCIAQLSSKFRYNREEVIDYDQSGAERIAAGFCGIDDTNIYVMPEGQFNAILMNCGGRG